MPEIEDFKPGAKFRWNRRPVEITMVQFGLAWFKYLDSDSPNLVQPVRKLSREATQEPASNPELKSFVAFCEDHPDMGFFTCLHEWRKKNEIVPK